MHFLLRLVFIDAEARCSQLRCQVIAPTSQGTSQHAWVRYGNVAHQPMSLASHASSQDEKEGHYPNLENAPTLLKKKLPCTTAKVAMFLR